MVSNEALGDRGRDVRCVKCGHVWFQKSERKHLDELIEKIQGETPDDIGFEAASAQKAAAAAQAKALNKPESKAPVASTQKSKNSSKNKMVMNFPDISGLFKKLSFSTRMAGIMTGVALFAALALVLMMLKGAIVDIVPALNPVYTLLGGLEKAEKHPLDKVIGLDHLSLLIPPEKGAAPALTGMMINLTKENVVVPQLSVTVMDDQHRLLDEIVLSVPRETLSQEESFDLNIPLTKHLPEHASKMEIRFSWPEKESPKTPEHH